MEFSFAARSFKFQNFWGLPTTETDSSPFIFNESWHRFQSAAAAIFLIDPNRNHLLAFQRPISTTADFSGKLKQYWNRFWRLLYLSLSPYLTAHTDFATCHAIRVIFFWHKAWFVRFLSKFCETLLTPHSWDRWKNEWERFSNKTKQLPPLTNEQTWLLKLALFHT